MSWSALALKGSNNTQIPIRAVQDFDHAMIHLGVGFTHSSRHNSIAAAATYDHYIVVGENSVHMRVLDVSGLGAPFSLTYYHTPTVSDPGTAATITNNNGNSSLVTDLSLYHAPTVTSVGTQVGVSLAPNIGGGGNSGVVAQLAGGEWIMPAGSTWLVRFTNEDAQAMDIVTTFFYYEPGLIKQHP